VHASLGVDTLEHDVVLVQPAKVVRRWLYRSAERKLLTVAEKVVEDLPERSRRRGDWLRAAGERIERPAVASQVSGLHLAAGLRKDVQPAGGLDFLDELGACLL
jgi:hypothetical protein